MSYFKTAEDIYDEMHTLSGPVDTSENSFIYNNHMPVAMEISQALMDLDEAEKKSFISLAAANKYSDYIDLRADEIGLTRKAATKAEILCTFTGAKGTVLPAGSIVGTTDNRLYVTENEITIGEDGTATGYVLANDYGAAYNVEAGEICYFPIKYNGITSVTNTEPYEEAYDKESDGDFLVRYYLKVQEVATSGNTSHYKQWCLSVTGVGSANVYECTNANLEEENGCVLCIITDSNHKGASDELIEEVKSYIETVRPVGAKVYIISSTELSINIGATLVINSKEYDLDSIKESIKVAIEDYFAELDSNTDINYVSVAKINSIIMNCAGVIDVRSLTLNNAAENIDIPVNSVGVLGTLTVETV